METYDESLEYIWLSNAARYLDDNDEIIRCIQNFYFDCSGFVNEISNGVEHYFIGKARLLDSGSKSIREIYYEWIETYEDPEDIQIAADFTLLNGKLDREPVSNCNEEYTRIIRFSDILTSVKELNEIAAKYGITVKALDTVAPLELAANPTHGNKLNGDKNNAELFGAILALVLKAPSRFFVDGERVSSASIGKLVEQNFKIFWPDDDEARFKASTVEKKIGLEIVKMSNDKINQIDWNIGNSKKSSKKKS